MCIDGNTPCMGNDNMMAALEQYELLVRLRNDEQAAWDEFAELYFGE